MSAWTVEIAVRSANDITWRVLDSDGKFIAFIDVPNTDEGRSTVAKMVAAFQMETALRVADAYDLHFEDCAVCSELTWGQCAEAVRLQDNMTEGRRAALAAAKRLL